MIQKKAYWWLIIIVFILSINVQIKIQNTKTIRLLTEFYNNYSNLKQDNNILKKKIIDELGVNLVVDYESLINYSGPKLIWRDCSDDCYSCLENTLVDLQSSIDKIGIENVLVLSDNENISNISSVMNNLGFAGVALDYLPRDQFFMPWKDEGQNSFFIYMDLHGKLSRVFRPDLDLPDLLQDYFNLIISELEAEYP